MPPPETMYCAQQINIPPALPNLLKQFTKAAIRTQPQDVLQWSADYFSALSKGQALPVKDRMDMPVATQKTDSGLTPNLLKTLHQQLASEEIISKEELIPRWKALHLPLQQLETILALGNFSENINWMQLFALGCSALGGSITSALKHACEILSEEGEDAPAQIPFSTFHSLFTYLALLDGEISKEEIDRLLRRVKEAVECKGGMVQPSIFAKLCIS